MPDFKMPDFSPLMKTKLCNSRKV